jgi:hypothetical protein
LHEQKLTVYRGDYDAFEQTRNELLRQQTKAHAAQEQYVAHIQKARICHLFLPLFFLKSNSLWIGFGSTRSGRRWCRVG